MFSPYLLPKTLEKKPFLLFLPFFPIFFPFFFFFFLISSMFAKFISEALAVGTAPKKIIKESIPVSIEALAGWQTALGVMQLENTTPSCAN